MLETKQYPGETVPHSTKSDLRLGNEEANVGKIIRENEVGANYRNSQKAAKKREMVHILTHNMV